MDTSSYKYNDWKKTTCIDRIPHHRRNYTNYYTQITPSISKLFEQKLKIKEKK